LLWNKVYDRIGSSDRTESIVMDGKGHIYLAGRSHYRTVDNSDYLLMKYDTNGTLLWTKNYDAIGHEWAYGIAVDPNDNVYLTGINTDETTGLEKMITIKYQPVVSLP